MQGGSKGSQLKNNMKFKTDCSIPRLADFWQKRLADITGCPATPLTKKEFGQLTQVKARLKHDTVDVVDWVLSNWPLFSQEAMKRHSVPSAPPSPHIGFLLKHYRVAVLVIDEQSQPTFLEWVTSDDD